MDRSDVLESLMQLMRLVRRYQGGGPGGGRRHSSHSEAILMRILSADDGLSSKELAEKMNIRPPSLSETLDRLEKRGEIERVRDEKDSRVYRIFLTERGRLEVEKRAEEYVNARLEVEGCLTEEEKRMFGEICGKLSAHLTALSEKDKKGDVV